jgi:hypothetical protein
VSEDTANNSLFWFILLSKLNLNVLKNPFTPVILAPHNTSPFPGDELFIILAKYLFSFLLNLLENISLSKSVKLLGKLYLDIGAKAISPELATMLLTVQSVPPS